MTSLPPQYPYTCNKCGKKIIMRNDQTFYEPGMTPLTGDIYLNDAFSDQRTVISVSIINDVNTNINTKC